MSNRTLKFDLLFSKQKMTSLCKKPADVKLAGGKFTTSVSSYLVAAGSPSCEAEAMCQISHRWCIQEHSDKQQKPAGSVCAVLLTLNLQLFSGCKTSPATHSANKMWPVSVSCKSDPIHIIPKTSLPIIIVLNIVNSVINLTHWGLLIRSIHNKNFLEFSTEFKWNTNNWG